MTFKIHFLRILLINLLISFSNTKALPSEEIVIQQQVYLLKNVIVDLHKIYNFENIIMYRTPSCFYDFPLKNFLIMRNLDEGKYLREEILYKSMINIIADHIWSSPVKKPLMTFTISPWEYVNNTQAIPNLGNILTKKNLAVVILNDIFNLDLREFVAFSLGASLKTKIVFFLVGHEITNVFTLVRFKKLNRFFRWCWSRNILNVIILFQKNHIEKSLNELELEVYTYSPFTRKKGMIRLTEQKPKDYFPNRIKNLLGYNFETPVIADKPLVFKTLDPSTGLETVTGISGKIFLEYVEYVNATFKELKVQNTNNSWNATMNNIHNLLNSLRMHISIHPTTALIPSKFFISYPISNTNSCVVVPVKQDIFPGLYIAKTLSLKVWFLFLLLFLAFQLLYMFINQRSYGTLKPWLAFATTLQGMLSMPPGNMESQASDSKNKTYCKKKLCLHMLLLLTGMTFGQTHLAALSSFLSSTLYPKQIESLEDLVKANLSLMLVEHIYDIYKYKDLIPANFSKNLIITDADTVSYHLNQLDTRYAYTVYNEEWKAMQHWQMHLRKPRFKIVPKLCIPNVYLSLPMQFNSPYYMSFKMFILYSQTAGLDLKWSDMIYMQIQQANSVGVPKLKNSEYEVSFEVEHLTYILYLYVGGMTAAGVVFLMELNWTYLSSKFKKIFKEKRYVK